MNVHPSPAQSARPPIRVLLADDSELIRSAVRIALGLRRDPSIQVVGETGTLAAAIAECSRLKPDLLLLDIGLPDGSGLEACRRILQQQPDLRVIVLTGSSTDDFVQEAILAGAHGYLMKEIKPKALAQAVVDVMDGKSVFDHDSTARAMRLVRAQAAPTVGESLATLSLQERRVLALVAEGQTNKEIGTALSLSENTVKNYLSNVFEKLQVQRRSQAASIYVRTNPGKR
ncbi:MAG TPA: response regulator transcription factor [Opitutaceae bacterium]|nr:response regulator transcription factor [Opitutaceae bacterium]